MKAIFKIIPTTKPTPTPEDFINRRQLILKGIGSEWYVNNIRHPKPPTKSNS